MVLLIGITAILNYVMRDKEIVIVTVSVRAHYNVEHITAGIIMILQSQLQTAVTEQVYNFTSDTNPSRIEQTSLHSRETIKRKL